MRTRTLQQLFDMLIDKGFYLEVWVPCTSSPYMCNAARMACDKGIITDEELDKIIGSIYKYLVIYNALSYPWQQTLRAALDTRGPKKYGCGFESRLALYKNWAKRPKLLKVNRNG